MKVFDIAPVKFIDDKMMILDQTRLPGEEVYSGLTAAVLAQNAGRVWLDQRVDSGHYESILAAAGLDNPAARIVAPAAAGREGSWYS